MQEIASHTTLEVPAGTPSWSGLDETRERECRELVETLHGLGVVPPVRRYEVGEDIFLEDEPGDGLYVLTEGMAKLSKTHSGIKEATLRLLGPWEVFGDLAPGIHLAQSADAQAFTACEAIKVPKIFVERASRMDREVTLRLLALLGLELAHHRELVGCLLPRATDARLAVLLPILARKFGDASGDAVLLPRLTHFDLAAMVASTRESVTAAMRSLRRRGLLEREGRLISILKLEELSEIGRAGGWIP
ncbi:MAG: Crp/Fnr family transcriptional regulator [Actinobacteria bacterium]|nr:Crp/Fnr family transcriptional regulator [Actinomycetota bacterium]